MKQLTLEAEVRSEFLVDKSRKKIWIVQLDLLKKLLSVCDKYNIQCFAFGGTLLGAVRHRGFIPWDDDIDIACTRSEYEKLCKIASSEFTEPYFFQTALTDSNYFLGMARLRNSSTTGIIKGFDKHKYNNGIALDIYVYDVLPSNQLELKLLLWKLKVYEVLINNYYYFNSRTWKMKIFQPALKVTKWIIQYDTLFAKYKRLCNSYSTCGSNRFGFLCNPTFLKYEVTFEEIQDIYFIPFEDIKMPVPAGYETILRRAYGNFMEFPPIEERGKWHAGLIILNPDISFLEYYRFHYDEYKNTIEEYEETADENISYRC